jgi:hypothetical protein
LFLENQLAPLLEEVEVYGNEVRIEQVSGVLEERAVEGQEAG